MICKKSGSFNTAAKALKLRFNGLLVLLTVALMSVASFAQDPPAAGFTIPTGTEDKLVGYVSSAFPVVIGVVIAVIGAGIIIKMLKRAG